jgi:trimethylamine--corrinoid protein Co-methyltransferase
MLGGASVMSFEQLVMDVEVFRAARAAHEGITVSDESWLGDAVARVDFGGSFLFERSTKENVRRGEWAMSRFGLHDILSAWERCGSPTTLEQARDEVERLLTSHQPEPLPDDVAQGLRELRREAAAAASS